MAQPSKVTIYLVEDQEMYAMMLDHKLKNNLVDHNLQIFESGEECLENINGVKPDVVILDYYLPGMNGMEVLKKVKEKDSSIPVIILSSQEDIQVTRDVLKAGAYDYIVKDQEAVDNIYESINNILQNAGLQNEVVSLQVKLNKSKMLLTIMGVVIIGLAILLIVLLSQ